MTRPGLSPSFAQDFPSDALLDAAVEAFAAGDYAWARAACARLIEAHPDDTVRKAASELLERTRPDRLAVRLLALTALLLVVLGGWWIAHGKAPSTVPSTPGTPQHG